MPLGLREFLFVGVLPALVAAASLALSWQLWRRGARNGHWGGPIAIGLAFALAHRSIAGAWPTFPPTESMGWICIAAGFATMFGLGEALVLRPPIVVRILIAAIASGGAVAIALRLLMRNWTIGEQVATLALFAGIGVLWWWSLEASGRDRGLTAPLILLVLGITIGMTLMLNGSLKFGQLGLSLAAAAGGVLVIVLVRRETFELTRGVPIVFTALSLSLILASYHLLDLPMIYVVPLLAAPAFVALGRVVPTARMRGWQRVTIRVSAVLIPMAAVLAVAVVRFVQSAAEEAG